MLICNNNCNGQQLHARETDLLDFGQQSTGITLYYALAIADHWRFPFDISIFNSMKVLIMHLCICIARVDFAEYFFNFIQII